MPKPLLDEVYAQAMQLQPGDRADLLRRLLDDAGEEGPLDASEWDAAWLPELMARRDERLRRGDSHLADAGEVVARVRASLPPREGA
jgi:hypothetical protein